MPEPLCRFSELKIDLLENIHLNWPVYFCECHIRFWCERHQKWENLTMFLLCVDSLNQQGMNHSDDGPSMWNASSDHDKVITRETKYVSDYKQDMEAEIDSLGEMKQLPKIGECS